MKFSRQRPRAPRLLALAIALLSCSSGEVDFGCSPTPSCSLHPERFEPKEVADAGPPRCGESRRGRQRCPAEDIAAGAHHSCGRTPAGELLCWGHNDSGQLGHQRSADAGVSDAGFTPVLEGTAEVSAGGSHSCAIDAEGAVHCFGDNSEGQLDGAPSDERFRSDVLDLASDMRATQVSAGGNHSCALLGDRVYCWGDGRHGQCGRERSEGALVPAEVPGVEDAVEISAGLRHSCARLKSDRVLCWGELFDGQALRATAEPQPVEGLDDAQEIAAGAGFSCALRAAGSVVCWGENGSGQLGDGSTEPSATPVEVLDLELALSIAAGGLELGGQLVGHACAQTKSFFVQCWGRNHEGQLGAPNAENIPRAVVVRGEAGEEDDEPFLPDVIGIAAGGLHSCAIDHDGPVLCWGDDSQDQLGSRERTTFGHPSEVRLFGGEYR
ncbi:MAG: hypothetical protein OEZ06_09020 [Myxococcales bacterium]|nr:hypothetical protein [Myxococcales bacterium]